MDENKGGDMIEIVRIITYPLFKEKILFTWKVLVKVPPLLLLHISSYLVGISLLLPGLPLPSEMLVMEIILLQNFLV